MEENVLNFSDKMSVQEFKEKYWYKADLQKICRKYKLPTYGTKYELMQYICQLLSGKDAKKIIAVRKKHRNGKLLVQEITPETKILQSGFSLNAEARKFFCKYFNVAKFSFTKSMGAKMREIESNGDENATVNDLIIAYKNPLSSSRNNNEETTYQWNNFVKDFNSDPLSKAYSSKMKVAAILWKQVKNSKLDKKYNRKLLLNNQNELKIYLKNNDI